MNRYKNAPAERTQNLSKDCKTRTPEKDFEDIFAATSEYYSEAFEKLAGGEPPGGNESSNSTNRVS